MNKKLVLVLTLVTSMMAGGLTPFAGLVMNASDDKVKSESPLGVFGVDYEWKYGSVGFKHTSSIPQVDETQGLNEFVGKLKYKLSFIEPYAGYTWTNEKLTSSYYTNQLGKTSKLVGLSIKYKDADIYTQFRDTGKQDMVEYGFVYKFYPERLVK